MSSDNFTITEHIVPGCHIREYAGSTVHQEDILKLHVKQYTPKNQPLPLPSDAVTLIATHGELYEPLWDEILGQAIGFRIRSIWVADCASMGMSGILNEEKLSMDCSWMDHARDLLLMINHFREQMPRPLVGIGHSFGGTIITNLAYMHPRLFTTVALIDPVIQLTPPPMGFGSDPPSAVNWTLRRDDVWPNREVALRANRALLHGWDPRCVARMAEVGFRELPTQLYPDVEAQQARLNTTETPVTLTTTKYQDLLGQIRENFGAQTRKPIALQSIVRRTRIWILLRLSFLCIDRSHEALFSDEIREGIKSCGTGVGGAVGGGQRVREVTLSGLGHLMPFQAVSKVAEPCVEWLANEMERYRVTEKQWEEQSRQKNHLVVGENWFNTLKPVAMRAEKPSRKTKM
ncbi:toxin biosynthesis protein-like protein [Penicillium chermesinum]|uniref:Toxin biosynthesis protein-like protein n=1 Tax=Penicillium chermesinum TaxID=63820 RepID=A0A9W9TZ49_9EURO|nr:toxin biosynthesis protein-like protein [Penicillium chermesinum]KAJ5246984.1 toxin biosynthesis protein-like protein [Penicillium chermesinum]